MQNGNAIPVLQGPWQGLCHGCADVRARERYYVLPEGGTFPLDRQTTALALPDLMARFRAED